MAADLDQRSPDATQWGVAASTSGSVGDGNCTTATGAVGARGAGSARRWPAGGNAARGAARHRATGVSREGDAVQVAVAASAAVATATAGKGLQQRRVPQQQSRIESGSGRSPQTPERRGGGNRGEQGDPDRVVAVATCTAGTPTGTTGMAGTVGASGSHHRQGGGKGRKGDEDEEVPRDSAVRQRGGRSLQTMDTGSPYGGGGSSSSSQEGGDELGSGPRGATSEERSEEDGAGSEAEGGGAVVVARPASDRLAHKLSVSLIDTYKLINQRWVGGWECNSVE